MNALPRRTFYLAVASIALFASGFLAAPTEAAITVRTLDQVVDLEGQRLLVVDLRIGSVEVEAGPLGRVEIVAQVRCSRFSRRCRREADRLELRVDRRTASIGLKATGFDRVRMGTPPQVDVVIRAPVGLDLEIDLGVGNVEVRNLEGNVDVDLGVGDVDVRLSREHAGTISLDVGVGSASIRPSHDGVRRSGFLIFGNEARWRDGSGSADIRIDVGVGSAAVAIE